MKNFSEVLQKFTALRRERSRPFRGGGFALAFGDFVGVGVPDDPNEFCTDRGAVEDADPYAHNSNACV